MTRKEFINEAMDLATIALNRGDHEAYRKCIEIIADEIYRMHEAENTEEVN